MKTNTHYQISAVLSALALLFALPSTGLAADSSSFTLYDEVSDIVDGSPLGSTSFNLNEAGETWIAYPLTGSNFQIVTAPPAQSSSSVAVSSSSSSSPSEEQGGGSGGHRGSGTNKHPPVVNPPTKPSAPSKDPVKPTLPELPAQVVDVINPEVTPLPGVDFAPSDPAFVTDSLPTNDARKERVTSRSHFFDVTEGEQCECNCERFLPSAPTVQKVPLAQTPIVSTLMLIIAFVLGYSARLSRPGHTALPHKKKK